MAEYSDTSMDELVSQFIVDKCPLLPKSSGVVSERVHFFRKSFAVHCGSAMEFYIKQFNSCITDVDALVFGNDQLAFIEEFPVMPHDMSCLCDTIKCFKIEPHIRYSGFVRLRMMGETNYNWVKKEYEFRRQMFTNGDSMFCAYDLVADSINIEQKIGTASIVSGPAITANVYPGLKQLDSVISLWCPQWPREAQGWPERTRDYGWPTIGTITEVVRNGCHVVYAQHRACRNDLNQWRFSFSVAEVILLQSWTKLQQIVYHLLRFYAKRVLIQKDCPKEDEVLCTYHLKTLMLWTCEEMSPEWWNSSSVIVICCELLGKLSAWLKSGCCPNYFIPEANLFYKPSNFTVLDNIQLKLDEFRNSKILCLWFVENYIRPHPFIQAQLKFGNTDLSNIFPHFADCMKPLFLVLKESEAQSLEFLFSCALVYCNVLIRIAMKSEMSDWVFVIRFLSFIRKFEVFTHSVMSTLPIPENVWCFACLDSAVFSLKAAYDLRSGTIAWKSELFAELVKELYLKPNIVRCQYHRYPEPTTTGSQLKFVRAHKFLEDFSGSEIRSEFQLVSLVSTAFLKETLLCDDSQSNIVVPATLVYLAALHFAAAEYQIVLDLCSSVLMSQATDLETLNASCLFFINDVVRIVGFCLLCKKILDNGLHYINNRLYIDQRLSPSVFAHYLTVISADRMSIQLKFKPYFPSASYPLEYYFMALTKRKVCVSMQSGTPFKPVRQCVYRKTDSVTTSAIFTGNLSGIDERKMAEAIMEIALENLTSFYIGIGIQSNTASCYRALYLYRSCKCDEVLDLCEAILRQPDVHKELKRYAYTNVLLLPPLSTFFDSDAQCLLGLHTLFYYLSPLNEDLKKFEITLESTFEHLFSLFVYSKKCPLSSYISWPYPISCHYSLGGHFLAKYLRLRCCIDRNHSRTKALAEFGAVKREHPFEHIIHRFVLQRFQPS